MKPFAPITLAFCLTLVACGKSSDVHEYKLKGEVARVLSCDKEEYTCQAIVFQGEKKKYNEVWQISGKPKKGDKVYRVCQFKIAPIKQKDGQKSAGLASRSSVEKTLDNNNCSELAHLE